MGIWIIWKQTCSWFLSIYWHTVCRCPANSRYIHIYYFVIIYYICIGILGWISFFRRFQPYFILSKFTHDLKPKIAGFFVSSLKLGEKLITSKNVLCWNGRRFTFRIGSPTFLWVWKRSKSDKLAKILPSLINICQSGLETEFFNFMKPRETVWNLDIALVVEIIQTWRKLDMLIFTAWSRRMEIHFWSRT